MATASNTANVDFAADAVTAGEDATHFGIWRAGALKAKGALGTDPAPITAQQFYRFPAGTLEVEIPAGDVASSGATDAVNGVLPAASEHQVSLHDADPTDDGSAAELTTAGSRATVPAGGWTVA